MKFKLFVKDSKGSEWQETYDKDVEDAEKYCRMIINDFNDTLRKGELKRTFLKVEIVEKANDKFHKWNKYTSGMSVSFRGNVVDMMYCEKCGITGKRYGLEDHIVIDSKFRKKAFKHCDTAQIELAKKG